jgi:NADPH-dependent 2,4-dienoyl-CoA reductase/sulfur reductase-like enzyme
MREILIVGGYAGFYTAWGLQKKLRSGEARVTVVDPRPYMTYQPFLPEVAAGSVEARHAVVSLRRHLRGTRLISGTVTGISNADRTVTVRPVRGDAYELRYDVLVAGTAAGSRSIPSRTGVLFRRSSRRPRRVTSGTWRECCRVMRAVCGDRCGRCQRASGRAAECRRRRRARAG